MIGFKFETKIIIKNDVATNYVSIYSLRKSFFIYQKPTIKEAPDTGLSR